MTQPILDTSQNTHDLQAEQSVLGAVLLDSECLDEIIFLEPRDFASRRNEMIYKVMRWLHDRDMPVDIITLTEQFQKHGRLEEIGNVMYLSELAAACPTAANVKYYANIVRSRAHRRRSVELADKIKQSSGGDYETDEEYFAAIDELVMEIRPKETAGMRGFKESKKSYFEHLKSKAEKLLTGFKKFDEWASLWRGWLYILAGRPSVGKTAKMLQMAYGVVKLNPGAGCVLIYSQEMDETELKDRMIANIAGVNYNRLINKGGEDGFTEREWEKINKSYDELELLPIYIQDSAGITIDEIKATARRYKKRHGKIAAIFVDYLQIMGIPQRKGESRAQAIGRVTAEAKQIARNLKCVMVMLCQLSRESENAEEPKLSHLKESGNIEQDADVVEFLWYNGETEGNVKVVQSIFAKGRNVGINKFRYRFESWLQRYVELEPKKEGDAKGGRQANSKRSTVRKQSNVADRDGE